MTVPFRPPETVHSVLDALAFWSARTPDEVALLAPGREPATYRGLHEAVRRLAGELRVRGFTRQEGITLLLPDGPDLCVMLLATIASGIAVPVALPTPEAAHTSILANPRVRAVVVSAETAASLSALPDHGLPVLSATRGSSLRIGDLHLEGVAWGNAAPENPPEPEEIALILHSSGTTGRPKLVPRTHGNIVAACSRMIETRAMTSADRGLSLARAAYSQGINAIMFAISSGGSLVVTPRPDVKALPHWLRTYRPTYLSTSPAVLRAIAVDLEPDLLAVFQQSSLTTIHSTAGPLSDDDLCRLESLLGVPILNGYGLSEASAIAIEPWPRLRRVPGSVGRPQCDIRLVDEAAQELAQHKTGEIVVRGPQVFPGYLDDPAANAVVFLPDGWFRTGDVGFVDADGYLHLTGRLGETINRGGEKIVPDEIDAALRSHPDVADAAVFAVPDSILGEDVVAAVVLNPGVKLARKAVHRWLLDRLPLFKVPRRIWFVRELPRTPTRKVQRGELARLWSEKHG